MTALKMLGFFVLLFVLTSAQAQDSIYDTVFTNKYGDTIKITNIERRIVYGSIANQDLGNGIHLIERDGEKFFHITSTRAFDCFDKNSGLFNFFQKKGDSFFLPYPVNITDTKIRFNDSLRSCAYLMGPASYKSVMIHDNRADNGVISLVDINGGSKRNFLESLSLIDNRYSDFKVTLANIGYSIFNGNRFGNLEFTKTRCQDLRILNSKINTLMFFGCSIGSLNVDISEDVNIINQEPFLTPFFFYLFQEDTFTQELTLTYYRPISDSAKKCVFNRCHINCPLTINATPFSTLVLGDCFLGEQFTLSGVLDTLVLKGNCRIENELNLNSLSYTNRGSIIHLLFEDDFDVSKLHFDYTSQFQLVMDMKQERAFLRLKEKFIQAGNTSSAQRLDIELKRLRYSTKGLPGAIMNIIERYYWDYGYDKAQPLVVIFTILFFFSFLNFIFWRPMNDAYKVGDDETPHKDMTIQLLNYPTKDGSISFYWRYFKTVIQNYLWVFLYTAIIFFSLRIAKDRLHFKGHGVAIFSYFFQYALGLFLLVITVKFVFGI